MTEIILTVFFQKIDEDKIDDAALLVLYANKPEPTTIQGVLNVVNTALFARGKKLLTHQELQTSLSNFLQKGLIHQ